MTNLASTASSANEPMAAKWWHVEGERVVGWFEADDHHPFEGGEAGADLGQPVGAVVYRAPVAVAVGREQEAGFDLAEPIDHPVGPEVG